MNGRAPPIGLKKKKIYCGIDTLLDILCVCNLSPPLLCLLPWRFGLWQFSCSHGWGTRFDGPIRSPNRTTLAWSNLYVWAYPGWFIDQRKDDWHVHLVSIIRIVKLPVKLSYSNSSGCHVFSLSVDYHEVAGSITAGFIKRESAHLFTCSFCKWKGQKIKLGNCNSHSLLVGMTCRSSMTLDLLPVSLSLTIDLLFLS